MEEFLIKYKEFIEKKDLSCYEEIKSLLNDVSDEMFNKEDFCNENEYIKMMNTLKICYDTIEDIYASSKNTKIIYNLSIPMRTVIDENLGYVYNTTLIINQDYVQEFLERELNL